MLSSRGRLEKICTDIIFDMSIRPRLASGRGNAMLVAGSIPEACRLFEFFRNSGTPIADKCAIVTSYKRADAGITPPPPNHCGAVNMVPVFDPAAGEAASDATLCIDQFEFPDIACEYPVVFVQAREAALLCRALGKRLCDAHEWEGACAGALRPPSVDYDFGFPRGAARDRHNRARELRWSYGPAKDHARCATGSARSPGCGGGGYTRCGSNTYPAGAFPACQSPFGVFDLHGNAAEHMSLPLAASELGRAGGIGRERDGIGLVVVRRHDGPHGDDADGGGSNPGVTRVDALGENGYREIKGDDASEGACDGEVLVRDRRGVETEHHLWVADDWLELLEVVRNILRFGFLITLVEEDNSVVGESTLLDTFDQSENSKEIVAVVYPSSAVEKIALHYGLVGMETFSPLFCQRRLFVNVAVHYYCLWRWVLVGSDSTEDERSGAFVFVKSNFGLRNIHLSCKLQAGLAGLFEKTILFPFLVKGSGLVRDLDKLLQGWNCMLLEVVLYPLVKLVVVH